MLLLSDAATFHFNLPFTFILAIAIANYISKKEKTKKFNVVVWHYLGSIVCQENSILNTWKVILTYVSRRLKALSNIALLIRSISKTCFTSYNKRIFKHCYNLFWYPWYRYTIKILVFHSKKIPIQFFKVLNFNPS